MSNSRGKSLYWSVCVCFPTEKKEDIIYDIRTKVAPRYCLILIIQEGHIFVQADIYFKFGMELNKTQVVSLLSVVGLNYPKRSLTPVTLSETERIRNRSLSSIELGWLKDPVEEDTWSGPINTDRRKFELEQEEDPDDPDVRESLSRRARAWRRIANFDNEDIKKYSKMKITMTQDGELGDPETHKRKQRRIEAELTEKLKTEKVDSDTEIDEPYVNNKF